MLKWIRIKIASYYASKRQYDKYCAWRGVHLGLGATGRCLACGFTKPINIPPAVAHRLELRAVETVRERNSRIRGEARRYGI